MQLEKNKKIKMEEKGKKIFGLIFGLVSLNLFIPLLIWLSFFLNIVFALFLLILICFGISFLLDKVMNMKFFFMGLVIDILIIAVLFFFIMGSCAESGGFESSANPGAGTSAFIISGVLAIFTIVLFIWVIVSLAKPPKEETKV